MVSTAPGQPTDNYSFPSPAPTASPDVPHDIWVLAKAVDTALKNVDNLRITDTGGIKTTLGQMQGTGWKPTDGKNIMDIYTKIPGGKIKYAKAAVDCNSAGDGTLNHQAGFIPTHWIMTPYSTGGVNLHVTIVVDARVNTTQNLGINCWDVKNNRAFSGTIGVSYTVRL